jgi:hypothetical protein
LCSISSHHFTLRAGTSRHHSLCADDKWKLLLAGSQKSIPPVVLPSQPAACVGATGAIIIIFKDHSSTIFNLSAPVSSTLRSNYVINLLIPGNSFLFDRPTVVIISINWK